MSDNDTPKFVCVSKSVSIILNQLKKNLQSHGEKKDGSDFFDDEDDVVFEGD